MKIDTEEFCEKLSPNFNFDLYWTISTTGLHFSVNTRAYPSSTDIYLCRHGNLRRNHPLR